jgi:hypothetical protein
MWRPSPAESLLAVCRSLSPALIVAVLWSIVAVVDQNLSTTSRASESEDGRV